jgi:aminopeptidase
MSEVETGLRERLFKVIFPKFAPASKLRFTPDRQAPPGKKSRPPPQHVSVFAKSPPPLYDAPVMSTVQSAAKGRQFPEFNLARLLHTVFEPTQGRKICILIDLPDLAEAADMAFLNNPDRAIQRRAHQYFYRALHEGVMTELGLQGGEMFAYVQTGGSNLDLPDECADMQGNLLSLERDIYPNYDLILCISTFSATAPLTAFAKQYGFRGATLHGLNEVILNSGLAVDYNDVSRDAEKLRLALTRADRVEIDFALESGEVLTAILELGGQEAQKSHGLCRGDTPDIANLPAGEVYFVPTSAEGHFPMKYEDGTLGKLTVTDGRIIRSELIAGNPATIDAHNTRLQDDPMTGVLGELGFGTQVLPVSGADIQDEKVLGTCHLATGRDDHLGGHITPDLFKRRQNATHDDILFAPHKTPNFDIRQVRMIRGDQREILIEHFQPSQYLLDALAAA